MSPVAETSTIAIIKTSWYLFSIAIFEFLNIPSSQMSILWILMIMDFISGVAKQFVINPIEITSYKAWRWAIKKISTILLVGSVALMFKWVGIDWSDYIKWVLSIFIMAETYSIVQNTYAIRTGKILPEYDVISTVIKKLWEFIINLIDKRMK